MGRCGSFLKLMIQSVLVKFDGSKVLTFKQKQYPIHYGLNLFLLC